MVECLTRDPRAVGSSLTGVTALCAWARHINPSLVLVQPRKTRPYITERLFMGRNKESNKQRNNAEPDEMPPYAEFHLGLHCLPKYLFTGIQDWNLWYPGLKGFNSLIHIKAFWHVMFLKILWKMEHLLQKSKCSIFHNIFKSIKNLTNFFLIFFFDV